MWCPIFVAYLKNRLALLILQIIYCLDILKTTSTHKVKSATITWELIKMIDAQSIFILMLLSHAKPWDVIWVPLLPQPLFLKALQWVIIIEIIRQRSLTIIDIVCLLKRVILFDIFTFIFQVYINIFNHQLRSKWRLRKRAIIIKQLRIGLALTYLMLAFPLFYYTFSGRIVNVQLFSCIVYFWAILDHFYQIMLLWDIHNIIISLTHPFSFSFLGFIHCNIVQSAAATTNPFFLLLISFTRPHLLFFQLYRIILFEIKISIIFMINQTHPFNK